MAATISKIESESNWGAEAAKLNQNFTNINTEITKVKMQAKASFGPYKSSSNLPSSASENATAWVSATLTPPFEVWQVQNGKWVNTGFTYTQELGTGDLATKDDLADQDAKLAELSSDLDSTTNKHVYTKNSSVNSAIKEIYVSNSKEDNFRYYVRNLSKVQNTEGKVSIQIVKKNIETEEITILVEKNVTSGYTTQNGVHFVFDYDNWNGKELKYTPYREDLELNNICWNVEFSPSIKYIINKNENDTRYLQAVDLKTFPRYQSGIDSANGAFNGSTDSEFIYINIEKYISIKYSGQSKNYAIFYYDKNGLFISSDISATDYVKDKEILTNRPSNAIYAAILYLKTFDSKIIGYTKNTTQADSNILFIFNGMYRNIGAYPDSSTVVISSPLLIADDYDKILYTGQVESRAIVWYDINYNYIATTIDSNGVTVYNQDVLSTRPQNGYYIGINARLAYEHEIKVSKRESISVKDFGAKGDGFTDDSDALIAAFSSAYRTVFIPEGTYIVRKTINITSNKNLYGYGFKKCIIKLADDTYDLTQTKWRDGEYCYPILRTVDNANNINIVGIRVKGSTKITDHRQFGIAVINSHYCNVIDCSTFNINFLNDDHSTITTNALGWGVVVLGSDNIRIEEGEYNLSGYENGGIEKSENVYVSKVNFGIGWRTSLQIHRGSKNIFIDKCSINQNNTYASSAITVHGIEDSRVENLSITNNYIYSRTKELQISDVGKHPIKYTL